CKSIEHWHFSFCLVRSVAAVQVNVPRLMAHVRASTGCRRRNREARSCWRSPSLPVRARPRGVTFGASWVTFDAAASLGAQAPALGGRVRKSRRPIEPPPYLHGRPLSASEEARGMRKKRRPDLR